MLCSKDLIDCIDLKVDDINSLSDHCMLRTFLSVSTFFEAEQKQNGTRCTRGDARSFFCTYKTYLYAQN